MARIYDDITQTVGNTPLVRIRKIISSKATVLAKLEGCNPMCSVKDRIGVAMIDAAQAQDEQQRQQEPGGHGQPPKAGRITSTRSPSFSTRSA